MAEATAASLPTSRGRLLRILGVGFGVAVAFGDAIGGGIVRTPGEIAARLPHAWLFLGVWLLGGLYALLSAFQLAELGAMIPRAGGQFNFSRRALGDYAGFIVGWSDWISCCAATAAVAIVVGEYTGALLPALANRTAATALGVTIAFTLLQWRGLRWGSRAQNVTSLLKALALLAVVAACFLLSGMRAEFAAPAIPSGLPLLGALVIALQSVIYTYDGWDGVVYFLEEVRDPARDVPRAMFGGVLSVMGIYLLLNLALVHVLPLEQIAGQNFALGLAAEKIFGAHGSAIIRGVMIVSLLAFINANTLMASRVLFGVSRDALFTRHAARVNAGGTPTAGLFVSTAVAAAFILTGTFERVIAIAVFFFVANYTLSFLSVFVLRRREPDLPRPYRAWGYPWSTGLALVASLAFLAGAVAGDTRNSVRAVLILAVSYPAYRLSTRLTRGASS